MRYRVREVPEIKCRVIVDTMEGSCFYIVEGQIRKLVDIIREIYESTRQRTDENFRNQEKYSSQLLSSLLSSCNISYPPYKKAPLPSFRSFFAAFTGCRLLTINGSLTALTEEDVLQLYRVIIGQTIAKLGKAAEEHKKNLDRMKLDELVSLLSKLQAGGGN